MIENLKRHFSVSESFEGFEDRVEFEKQNTTDFGISFLDDALDGISTADLILIGGRSGSGKTELATTIAANAASAGRDVYYFALEAEKHEISNRLAYREFANLFFTEKLYQREFISYPRFLNGSIDLLVKKYKEKISEALKKYNSLNVEYSTHGFTLHDLEKSLTSVRSHANLIVIDHLHYFDFDSENENKELKSIVKKIRSFVLDFNIPVILVAHVRKRDLRNPQLVPDQEDFHGSSDIIKIATKAITIGSAYEIPCMYKSEKELTQVDLRGFGTYMRAVKYRRSGAVSTANALLEFDSQSNNYRENYFLGSPFIEKNKLMFLAKSQSAIPNWAKRAKGLGDDEI